MVTRHVPAPKTESRGDVLSGSDDEEEDYLLQASPMLRTIVNLIVVSTCSSATGAPLRVLPCSSWSGDAALDGWSVVYSNEAGGAFTVHNKGLCLDTEGGIPVASVCASGKISQLWRVDSNQKRLFTSTDRSVCRAVDRQAPRGHSFRTHPAPKRTGGQPTQWLGTH